MKKILIIAILTISCVIGILLINKKETINNLKTVKVAEVTHSAFYAPFYVAIEKGYFKEYGIDIDLLLTPGADKVGAAVLSNDADIGFCGPENSIYVYNGGEKDYIISFAGLTKRDGQFILSREKIDNFNINMLKGKEVLGGRIGGMPLLNFQQALINSDVNLNDVTINTSIEFAALSGAFIGGTGDFVNLFEPNATKLENEGFGYVVSSIGMYSDEVPYTAFNARKSFIIDNEEIIKNFTKAINKGLEFVNNNEASTIAKIILTQFPDTSLNTLEKIVSRYKNADSWLTSSFISEKSFNNLQEMLIRDKQIEKKVPYNVLINNINNE